jgi:hypothetical protein
MKGRPLAWSLFALVVLAASLAPLPEAGGRPGSTDRLVRLLGPVSGLAANVQWVRADLAFRGGRIELFHSRARTALTLAPDSAEGWKFLARQQAYALGSPEREPDGERRLSWVRAGLATALEGERRAARPAELAWLAGFILTKCATVDPELPWPGGPAGLWEEAAGHFERAAGLEPDPELADTARKLALSARRAAQAAR